MQCLCIVTSCVSGFVICVHRCKLVINFSSYLSCRYQRARPIIIDPGLYHSKKSGVFWAKEKRVMPASFKLFMGNVFSFVLDCQLTFCSFLFFIFHLVDHFSGFFFIVSLRFHMIFSSEFVNS